jgi:hypothetical protein
MVAVVFTFKVTEVVPLVNTGKVVVSYYEHSATGHITVRFHYYKTQH